MDFYRPKGLFKISPLTHKTKMNTQTKSATSISKISIWGLFFAILTLGFSLRMTETSLWLAIFSALTILGVFLLTREIFKSNFAGLVSAYLIAVSSLAIDFSEIGAGAVMVPLLLSFCFYFIFKGLRTRKLHDFIIAGLIYGIGIQVFVAIWISPLAVIALLGLLIIARKNFLESYFRHVLVFIFSSLISAILVLLFFFYSNYRNLKLPSEMLPLSYFGNYPGLNLVVGLGFLVGTIYLAGKFARISFLRLRRGISDEKMYPYFFLLIWAITILIPMTISDVSNGIISVSISSLPAIFTIASIPFMLIARRTEKFGFSFKLAVFSLLFFSFIFIGIFDTIRYMAFLNQ